jgi:hypothetical protein
MEAEVTAELRLENSTLSYRDEQGQTRWEVCVSNLVLIAEYTTNEGPWCDDYFFIFWAREDGKLFVSKCPLLSNSSAVFEELGRRLGDEIHLGLIDSTDWKSRVVWPPKLAGEDYFTFTKARSEKWLTSLWYQVIGTQEYQPVAPVMEFLHDLGALDIQKS